MNKTTIRTNLENTTLEEKERFIENLIEAHSILFQSVVKRTWKEKVDKYANN